MTSNIGSALLVEAGETGSFDEASDRVRELLRDHFRPEFLNRIDEIIVFRPLDSDQLSRIVGLLIGQLERRLAEEGLKLSVSDEALAIVAQAGYDPTFGARPLRRAVQRLIENPLARRILAGEFVNGDTVRIEARDGELVFEKTAGSAAPPAEEAVAAS
jgi:ATP-dependent Clp protease ATP-binding subunit ClpB